MSGIRPPETEMTYGVSSDRGLITLRLKRRWREPPRLK